MRSYEHFNFPAFDQAAHWLRSCGHDVISPAEHDREEGFDETRNSLVGFDMRAALLWDLTVIINEAQCVWLLPGWERSTGCAAEVAVAKFLDLPIFEMSPDLADYAPMRDPVEVP